MTKEEIKKIEQKCKKLKSREKECLQKIKIFASEGNHVKLYFQYRLKLKN